jgi:hypothetical protein
VAENDVAVCCWPQGWLMLMDGGMGGRGGFLCLYGIGTIVHKIYGLFPAVLSGVVALPTVPSLSRRRLISGHE